MFILFVFLLISVHKTYVVRYHNIEHSGIRHLFPEVSVAFAGILSFVIRPRRLHSSIGNGCPTSPLQKVLAFSLHIGKILMRNRVHIVPFLFCQFRFYFCQIEFEIRYFDSACAELIWKRYGPRIMLMFLMSLSKKRKKKWYEKNCRFF